MLKKQTSYKSVDGFIPTSNRPRSVGFTAVSKASEQPNFPAMGQTLSTYRPAAAGQMSNARTQARTPYNSFDMTPPGVADDPIKKSHRFGPLKKAFGWKRVLIVFLIVVFGIGGWLGFKFIHNLSKTFHGGIFSILTATKLKGEDSGRVNILLAGNSSDDPGHSGANLTDSIMIISIDTKNNSAYMLSVPRDLYVDIPGFDHAKINEAYVDGQNENFNQSGYFPGGMGLLQKVIQQNFNLTLNYYALINYNALRDMVNAVGGIDFTVKSQDKHGLYDPSIDYVTHGPLVKLTNGVHHLNGEQALDLARARGDAYGSYGFPQADFDRTNNQRQEILALKSKAATTGVLANPAKLSSLLDAIGNNIKTNFSLSEVHRLYDIGKSTTSIKSIGLNNVNGKNLLTSYQTYSGQSALIAAAGLDNFTAIQAAIQQLTSSDPVVREGAAIAALNATDTSGIAAKAAKNLISHNLLVTVTADARANQATTTIIDASGGKMPATKQLLMNLYGSNVTTVNPYVAVYDVDFIIVLGQNQVPHTSTPATSTSSQ